MAAFAKRLRRLCAFVVGAVLFFSGIVKLMDPVGTSLVMGEYFRLLHLSFLDFAALPAGVALSLLEALLGAALLCGVFRKLSAIITFGLLTCFTAVTLMLWLSGVEMDCGCFGKVLPLTQLESLIKNIALLLLSLAAFVPFRSIGAAEVKKYIAFGLIATGTAAFAAYSFVSLPVLDYTPFAPGAELFASLDNDYQATDGYKATFVYEKNGRRGSFNLDNLPDSTWTFVGVDTLLRSSVPMHGSEAPILSFRDGDGEYQDELAVLGRVMVVSVYRPSALSEDAWARLGEFMSRSAEAGARPLLLVAGAAAQEEDRGGMGYYQSDHNTLISLNRSNGGATYIADGEIVRKWPGAFLPDSRALGKLMRKDPADAAITTVTKGRIRFQSLFLYVIAILILL